MSTHEQRVELANTGVGYWWFKRFEPWDCTAYVPRGGVDPTEPQRLPPRRESTPLKEATQRPADVLLEWYLKRYGSGEDRELPKWATIEAAFQNEGLVDLHVREMCFDLFGVPVATKQTLTGEQWELVREVINMRTGAHGAQMMAANAASMEECADIAQAPGSRRDQVPPGPSRRRESGEDPTDRGRWWQRQNTTGGDKRASKGNGKNDSQAVGRNYGESGVFRSPSGAGGACWPTDRDWEWRSCPR